jgi:hypothetical protein
MVNVEPAATSWPGVDGLVKASKPGVCANTLETAARAKKHDLTKEYCIVIKVPEETEQNAKSLKE